MLPLKVLKALTAITLSGGSSQPPEEKTDSDLQEKCSSGSAPQRRFLKEALYIRPSLAHHIEAPLPETSSPEQLVGIYGNILYPQDQEQISQQKLIDWIETASTDPSASFPLTPEEMKDISLYVLDRFTLRTLLSYFTQHVNQHLKNGHPLEIALQNGKRGTLQRAALYKYITQRIPVWEGRCKRLTAHFHTCVDQIEQLIDQEATVIQNAPQEARSALLQKKPLDLIEIPFTWDIRLGVFKQMFDKTIAASPHSPYFLALQEVTPQALSDLKTTLSDRGLQWISFNNISGKETLDPRQEKVLGESTGFTSTIALSPDLEILKVKLGDLPNESGSIRRILGVRVRNPHTSQIFNLFTTHTDHKIENEIYARTANKMREFVTQFTQDTPNENRYILGGDLNAFKEAGGDQYLKTLKKLFPDSRDFRETDYYAPLPIAWSSFIGHGDDTYSGRIAKDGILEPNAFDHILVGGGIQLQSAAREAAVYNPSGQLLDYYQERDEYLANLQTRVTFSDHFFNIVRFK